MDWNGTFRQESSLDFLYNYNFDQYSGFAEAGNYGLVEAMKNDKNEHKKKKLTREQLDALERSFQEEIKLDPDRKMRLSMELGLQARQVAVWFQNRRARWKAKRLEHSYHMLKQHYDVICREKQMLQHEVIKLKGMLMERGTRNYTDISGEVADENTSICRWSEPMIAKNYYLDMDEYYPVSTLDVGAQLPSYHH